jgi:multicomponent Na+:H+ antiporter subunit D
MAVPADFPAMIETATPASEWVIVLPVALALLGSAILVMLRKGSAILAVLSGLVIVAMIACEIALILRIVAVGPVSMTMGKWLPPFGISFTADLFGAVFALAAAVVTLFVLIYAEADRPPEARGDGFHGMLLLLLAGVTGSFLTGDLFNLYVWFEVMLIASFGLLVLGGRPIQLDGAVKYGFLNFLATSFFLLSLGLLYGLVGTLNMADILQVAPSANPAAMTAVAGLLLLAFGMKAAAFPVNNWLPASYHAPPAAVAALFAGLLTKVGIYALLRALVVVLPASRDLLEPVLALVAIATLIIGPLGAIAETNLRRAVGFMLIGGIGAVMAGIAIPNAAGAGGAGLYILHAMVSMAAFYLVLGIIERRTGQVDSRQMGGIYASNTAISILFFVLMLAIAGLPPFLGFWPKLLLIEGGLTMGGWTGSLLVGAILVNAVLTLIAGSRLWAHIFWRPAPQEQVSKSAIWPREWVRGGAAALLTVIVVAAGLWPNPLFEVVRTGAADMLDSSRYVEAFGLRGDGS